MIAVSDIESFFTIPQGTTHIYNLAGSSAALFLSLREEPFIAVERTEESAMKLYEDIRFFLKVMGYPRKMLHYLPEPNGMESSGRRAEVMYGIEEGDSLVTSVKSMDSPIWRPEDLKSEALVLRPGQEAERETVARGLRSLGYKRVSLVMETGEFSTKGWLLDIFPSTMKYPVRIEFFGDEIEKVKSFDIDSQRSISTIERVTVMPVTEPYGDTRIQSLVNGTPILVDLLPSESPSSFLPAGTSEEDARAGIGGQEHAYNPEHAVSLSRLDVKGEGYDAGMRTIRGLGIYPEERKSLGEIAEAIATLMKDQHIVIVSPSEAQAERVKDILFEGGVVAPLIGTEDLMNYEGSVAITQGKLSSGFFMPGFLILTEREIFGERPPYRPLKQSKVSKLLASMDDISPGDFVVHPDHGIGKFLSVQKEKMGDFEHDLLVLEYAGKDRLYIPLYNIDRIKKYNAEEAAIPLLDKLGGKTWQRRKERVKKAVKEMAEKLLKLYAERAVAKSFSFSVDTELHREFYGFFPYEETPDQVKAAEEIARDMESERPMDRLLCGDVGYGKTEVAMRAAFKAVYDGRQVAVLVPTTILCEQHYHTFKARFSAFPVKIEYISRFKSKRERNATMHAVARGEIDIIVGTHSLLRKETSFCSLGLLIIDEEHRFGVGQKERIKELKQGVDILSMTATPIPRTLHMAISGIRAMSVIETPPEERLAVRSMVSVFDADLIKEAMERELQRGGQVLFVHNTIFDIEKIAALLKRFMPDARFGIAHGQMPERRLEEVMLKFVKGETDVLVSTTIIGSGIDIPTANTILINRADRIGLSDLYQLRGRVGRSNVRAYAYFLIPGKDLVSEDAKKRLQAISEMSYLGAGFRLAMKDLEMRGAGNLLGPQQSGHIHAVGFEMYVEMLEKAVAELKGIEIREETEPSISLKITARVPEEYIEDMSVRMSLYRRIANAHNPEDLSDIEAEMKDRFGTVPEEVRRLLDIMRLKIMARRLSILKIFETDRKIRVVFSKDTVVATEKVLALQKAFHGMRFHKDGFELNLVKPCDSLSVSYDVLQRLN
jgi:transcription-repair coupling factor (superfamily II helicase)